MVEMTTYIYIRPEDGKCVHSNCGYGFIGGEYEHEDPNWQPPKDWPYKIRDFRKEGRDENSIKTRNSKE